MSPRPKLSRPRLFMVAAVLTLSTTAFQLLLHRWLTVESAPVLTRLQYAGVDSALLYPVFLAAVIIAWRIVGAVRAETGSATHPLERAAVVASASWVLLGAALFVRDQLIARGVLGGIFISPLPGFICGAELNALPMATRTREAMLGLLRLAPVVFGMTALIAYMLERGAVELARATGSRSGPASHSSSGRSR